MKNLKFVLLLLVAASVEMFASDSGGRGLPWESAMTTLTDSLTGPVAFGISLVAIVGAGVGLIFGGEISGFLKASLILALVIGLIVSASSVLTGLFSGAATIALPLGVI